MTDRPIIFSALMVRALLAGEKTMTRRLAWRAKDVLLNRGHGPQKLTTIEVATHWQRVRTGDRLWVREAFAMGVPLMGIGERPYYRADEGTRKCGMLWSLGPWRPSIFMPRWASRLTLIVTETKIERVQEISVEGAEAEGACSTHDWDCAAGYSLSGSFHPDQLCNCGKTSAQETFGRFWDALHKPGNRWMDNPEIVALAFEVVQSNIDEIGKAA